jgi:uncharacterized protein YbjT (DUF2867 family)
MYVVTGATGNTGSVVAEKLLAAGKRVRVIGRDAKRLQSLVNKGAEAVVASLEDAPAVTAAFAGATAAYAMIPPHLAVPDFPAYQRRVGEAIAGALRASRVRHVVHLSSFGAQNRTGCGPVSGLALQEERLDAVPGCNVLHLRPGFFMENLYGFLGMIPGGFIAAPTRGDVALPWIATRDIGAVAAAALLELNFTGHTVLELHGARDLTWPEAVRIVGQAMGKPGLRYVQASYEDAEKGILQMGISPSVARGFLEMYRAMNEGRMKPVQPRTDRTTTPTTLESFAKGLAASAG